MRIRSIKIFQCRSLKEKILRLIILVTTLSIISFTALSFYFAEKTESEMIEQQLFTVAVGARNVVGDDFHDSIVDSSSVLPEEYKMLVNKLSEYAHDVNVREIYTYIKYKDELRFTSASLAYEDYLQNKTDTFFTKYYGDAALVESVFFKPLNNNEPASITYREGTTHIKSVFIPYTTQNGNQYVIGVDFNYSDYKSILNNTLFIFLALGFIILIFSIWLSYRPIKKMSTPLKKLVSFNDELVANDFHLSEPSLQNLFKLSTECTDEVGQLCDAFLSMQFSLSQYIVDLKNTTKAKESIEAQLKIAANIQMSMIPSDYPSFPDRNEFDICGSMVPAKEVGGDLFNYFLVDSNHLAFTIGDVSDKGVPAALFMSMTNTLIKALTLSGLSPAEVLFKANNELVKDNEQCMFVTLVLGILDIKTGNVVFANAGHNPFIVLQKNKEPQYHKMETGMVLAAFEDIAFTNEYLQLQHGDSIFLYTDGVTEAKNRANQLYGEERLIEIMKQSKTHEVNTLIESVCSGVSEFVNGFEQSDDITTMALRYNIQ